VEKILNKSVFAKLDFLTSLNVKSKARKEALNGTETTGRIGY
jgi:hypothetical protein